MLSEEALSAKGQKLENSCVVRVLRPSSPDVAERLA